MFKYLVFFCLLAVAFAAPAPANYAITYKAPALTYPSPLYNPIPLTYSTNYVSPYAYGYQNYLSPSLYNGAYYL